MRTIYGITLASYFSTFVSGAAVQPREEAPPESAFSHILEARNISHLQTKFAQILRSATLHYVFHLEDSNTYVARKDNTYWNVEENLDDLVDPKKKKNKKDVEWVEFGFDKIYESRSSDLIPVSHCHSQVNGQGGTISVQGVMGQVQTLSGTLGITPWAELFAVTLTSTVTLERPHATKMVLACNAKHGEVVQIFLEGTRFLYYTPRVRELAFDKKKNQFRKPGKFMVQPQKKAVVRGGVGDWVCGSSTVIPLQCSRLIRILSES